MYTALAPPVPAPSRLISVLPERRLPLGQGPVVKNAAAIRRRGMPHRCRSWQAIAHCAGLQRCQAIDGRLTRYRTAGPPAGTRRG